MKNIATCLLLYMFSYSCEPTTECREFYIENKTDKNLELVKFSNSVNGTKSEITNIQAKSSSLDYSGCNMGSNSNIYHNKDSIQIRSNGSVLRTYFPNEKGKSIYKMKYYNGVDTITLWKRLTDDYNKFAFEITEEDLKK